MNQNTNGIILNVVPLKFSSNTIQIGRMKGVDKESYRQLREQYAGTHAFRYDSQADEIQNIAIAPNIDPVGRGDLVSIPEHLPLIARAIQQSIFVWLTGSLRIIRKGKKIVFWGQADSALLLSQAVLKLGLKKEAGLEVALRYEIDCRIFQYAEDKSYLGLVIDLATSNIIDIPATDLQARGLEITGRYVCRYQEGDTDSFHRRLELLGRVSALEGTRLLLTDSDGSSRVEATDVLLEPRFENFRDVVELCYGTKASQVLTTLANLRQPINNAPGKLELIRKTVDQLRPRPIVIGNDVSLEFGRLLDETSEQFPQRIETARPTFLFGPQGKNTGIYPDIGITTHGPYMYMYHDRNAPLIAVVCESQHRGTVEQFLQLLRDGFPNEMWKNAKHQNPFPHGLVGKYRLSKIRFEYEECLSPTAQAYQEAATRLLGRLPSAPDLAVVQIREGFQKLYGSANPYLTSKAAFMMAGVPTQSVQIEKISSPDENIAYLLNTISLASYAKLDGTPWVLSTIRPTTHEIVVGLGSTEARVGRLGSRTRYVGITSVFQGDGRYLIWGATREVEYEHYPEALLETLRTAVRHVQQHNAWQEGDKVRIICHVYKRLRDCEVEATKSIVRELANDQFSVEFAFLDISPFHPYHLFNPSQAGVQYWDLISRRQKTRGAGVPQRGICLQLDKLRGLLHLTGPGDLKTGEQGVPKPLLIELHRDSDFTDMTYLLRQAYHFAYMSWRSFFPSTEPITITYSRLIARLLADLKTIPDWNSNVLTFGNLRDRRWFL